MASRASTPLVHPRASELDLFSIMSALADPVRRGIVVNLSQSPNLSCSETMAVATASSLTRHFRVLREAGLIWQRNVGNRRENMLRKEDIDSRFPGLMDMVLHESIDPTAAIP